MLQGFLYSGTEGGQGLIIRRVLSTMLTQPPILWKGDEDGRVGAYPFRQTLKVFELQTKAKLVHFRRFAYFSVFLEQLENSQPYQKNC